MIRYLVSLLFTINAYASLDSHVHFFAHETQNVKKYLEIAKENGITHSFVLSAGYGAEIRELMGPYKEVGYDEYIQQQNSFVADLQAANPDQFSAFCSIPWGYEEAKALIELKRCVSLGMKGLKVYPVKFFMTGDGRYNALNVEFDSNMEDLKFLNLLIDFANEHHLIFGIHSSQIDSNGLVGFLYQSNYRYTPNLKVIFLHAFAAQSLAVLTLLKDHLTYMPRSKIFIELSFSELYMNSSLRAPFVELLNQYKTEHILFGSDSISWSGYGEQRTSLEMYRNIFDVGKLNSILNNTKIYE